MSLAWKLPYVELINEDRWENQIWDTPLWERKGTRTVNNHLRGCQCACLPEQSCAVCRPEFSVFVGDLASDMNEFQLHQVFKKYPSCKGAKVVTDQYGYSRWGSWAQFEQADVFSVMLLLPSSTFTWNMNFKGTCCDLHICHAFFSVISFLR